MNILINIGGFMIGICVFLVIAFGVGFVIDWYKHG